MIQRFEGLIGEYTKVGRSGENEDTKTQDVTSKTWNPNREEKKNLTAIATQHRLTYGLSRSPIRAHFQKMPKTL